MMFHCPYCGSVIKEDEQFCVTCGKQLPDDIHKRSHKHQKSFNYLWFIPIAVILLLSIGSISYYYYLKYQHEQAIDWYEKGVENLLFNAYDEAEKAFQKSLEHKSNFPAAEISLSFVQTADLIQTALEQAQEQLIDGNYQEALTTIDDVKDQLSLYDGTAVTPLIEQMTALTNEIELEQVKYKLTDAPSIDELKYLLWDAEAIPTPEAHEIAREIREQIINHTHTKASELLNQKQFSDALLLIEDGLQYASDSEKLISLQSTVEKEKEAFETTQQQRIEQAMNIAAEEQEVNESDALTLDSIQIAFDEQNRLIVQGEVTSVATVPIHSIMIEYTITSEYVEDGEIVETELLTNQAPIFPDTLYPDESGQFEFTHFDIESNSETDLESSIFKVDVDKMTWYLE